MLRAAQLQAYLSEVGGWRFNWRSANCVQFAAGWIERLRGEPLEGLPLTLHGLALYRRAFGSFEDAVSHFLCHRQRGIADQIEPPFAQVGDLVSVGSERRVGRGALGIVAGRLTATLAEGGLLFVPTSAARCAWRLTL